MKMNLVRFLFLIFVAMCIAPETGAQTGGSMEAQVQAKAELAVAQFQQRAGGRLDYSEKSIAVVEEMLEEAAQYSKQMSPKDITALTELMGSYILAVAYRNHGGVFQWYEERSQPVLVVGEPRYSIGLMTFDKVRGRLSGDKADNIVFFYEGFSSRIKSATPGIRALYL